MKVTMKTTLVVAAMTSTSVGAQRFVTSYGQHLHADFADQEIARALQGGGQRSRRDQAAEEMPTGGGGRGSGGSFRAEGSEDSTACAVTDGYCEADGSSNSGAITDLTYDSDTGKFEGTITTNLCNDHPRAFEDGTLFRGRTSVDCITQQIPAPKIDAAPHEIPLLGRTGMTLSGGVNIYSPFEAGFSDCSDESMTYGRACACDGASCEGGLDVGSCEKHLEHSCSGDVESKMFMDTCGGHADPYHIHTDPMCNYVTDESTGHSTLLGVALDGHGIYGKFESHGDQRPCDLDACHGHVGMVPVNTEHGVVMTEVYHYHVSDADVYPYTWTLGCYGDPEEPVSVETCEFLYDGCTNGETATVFTDEHPDGLEVKLFCPCYESAPIEGCEERGSLDIDQNNAANSSGADTWTANSLAVVAVSLLGVLTATADL